MTHIDLIDPPEQTMTLTDGRTLGWQEYGDPNGTPVLYFHGGGGTALEGGIFHRDGVERGVRIIATHRPGAGSSSLRPGRPIAAYSDDLRELLDHLGIEEVACFGESNGGLTTMAVAATMADRVVGGVPINPTVPWSDKVARRVAVPGAATAYRMLKLTPKLVAWVDAKVADKRRRDLLEPPKPVEKGSPAELTGPPPGAEPDIAALHRRVISTRATKDGLLAELKWASDDWGFDHYAIPGPIDFFCGVHDPQAPFALILADENPDARFHYFSYGHQGFSHPDARRRIFDLLVGYFEKSEAPVAEERA